VGELSSCMWHPKDPKTFITSSADSTIRCVMFIVLSSILIGCSRIWDIENKRKQKSVIVVKSKERGARTKVTACAYSPDGSMIGGGASSVALSGSISMLIYLCLQRVWTEPSTYGKQARILFGPIRQSRVHTSKVPRLGLWCFLSTVALCSQGGETTP
jgi:WD40 repeat protein